MKRSLPPLLALRAFESAARHLSFTKAGEELHVTQAAISRQVKLLEEYLNTSLFNRLTRHVELTPFGRTYLDTITAALDLIEQVSNEHLHKAPKLAISILPSTGALWLQQKMMEFSCIYPEIRLDVSSSLDPVIWNDGNHNFDLAIRLGKLPGATYDRNAPQLTFTMTDDWTGIAAVHLWDDYVTPFCTKKFLAKHGPFDSAKDLKRVTLLYNNFRPDIWPAWLRANGAEEVCAAARLDFSHSFLVANAMRSGLGMACLSKVEIDPTDWRDELVQPFDSCIQSAGAYYLLTPQEKLQSHDVQLFLHWLKGLYSG